MAKGSSFEREIAKTLSLWWSNGKHEDLCWRTSNSGGRATVRGRKGKKTAGHCGDLGATDDRMLPFFKLVTLEIKRGYNKSCNLHNLFDPPARESKRDKAANYPTFLRQARRAAKRAGTPYWLLVHRPDRKNAVVFGPMKLLENVFRDTWEDMEIWDTPLHPPWAMFHLVMGHVFFCTLSNFLATVTRKDFLKLAEK